MDAGEYSEFGGVSIRLAVSEALKFWVGCSGRLFIALVFGLDAGVVLKSDRPSLSMSPSMLVMERYSRSAARELKSILAFGAVSAGPLAVPLGLVIVTSNPLWFLRASGGEGGNSICCLPWFKRLLLGKIIDEYI